MEALDDNQQQQQQQPQTYQTPLNSFGSSILFLTNPEPIIQELVLTLKCQTKDENGNIIQYGEPLLNDVGINSVVSHVRPFMNQVTVMSNLDENEICRLIMLQADVVIQDLMINKRQYGIKNDSQRSTIVKAVTVHTYITMKRAIMGAGNEKGFWKGSTQEITMRNQDNQKKNAWDFLGKW